MTEPTLRERIARAICRVEMRGALSGVDLDRRVDEGWSYYRSHADKVLAIPELTAIVAIPIIGAAQEWAVARKTVLGAPVTAESYDRLTRAEAALQRAVQATNPMVKPIPFEGIVT